MMRDGTRRYVTEIVGEGWFLNHIAGREDSGDGYQQDIPRESIHSAASHPSGARPDRQTKDLPFLTADNSN